jgi:hypothetical protein
MGEMGGMGEMGRCEAGERLIGKVVRKTGKKGIKESRARGGMGVNGKW